jgi:hypothetical protein
MKYLVTEKSRNAKTGPILVTTSPSSTCPDACPLKADRSCYAKSGPLDQIWRGLDKTEIDQQFKNGKGHVTVRSHELLLGAPSDGDQRFRLKTSSCTD